MPVEPIPSDTYATILYKTIKTSNDAVEYLAWYRQSHLQWAKYINECREGKYDADPQDAIADPEYHALHATRYQEIIALLEKEHNVIQTNVGNGD